MRKERTERTREIYRRIRKKRHANAPWTRKRRPKRFVTPLDYWTLPSFRHFFDFFFFFLFFLFLVFFCLSNLTHINCGIALKYLLANGDRPCLVVSLLCKWYETRRKFRNSSSVVIQNFVSVPKIYFLIDCLHVKYL